MNRAIVASVERSAALGMGFGLAFALLEVHAVWMTTARFEMRVFLALVGYYAVLFGVAGVAVTALARRLRPGEQSVVPLALVGLVLLARVPTDLLFTLFRHELSSPVLFVGVAATATAALFLALRRPRAPVSWPLAVAATAGLLWAELAVLVGTRRVPDGLRTAALLAAAGLGAALPLRLLGGVAPRTVVLGLGAVLLATGAWRGVAGEPGRWRVVSEETRDLPAPPPGAQNVLLVVLDTVRADHLEIYGYRRSTMPHLARFAAGATRYDDASAAGSWTLPSHASLFTGLLPSAHGAHGERYATEHIDQGARPLAPAALTLAEVLAAAGWRTEGVVGNHIFLEARYGLHQGFAHWDARPAFLGRLAGAYHPLVLRVRLGLELTPLRLLVEPLRRFDIATTPYRSAGTVTDEVLERLRALEAQPRPWLLFVNYMDAHEPYRAPPEFAEPFPGRRPDLSLDLQVYEKLRDPDAAMLEHLHSIYDAELRHVDHHLGRLLDAVTARGLLERTIVVITADHGEAFLEHGEFGHGKSLHQEELRVPLVIRDPETAGAGRVESTPVSLASFAPWLLTRLGVSPPAPFAPLPHLAAGAAPVAELYDVRGPRRHPTPGPWMALRDGPLKLLRAPGASAVFDLSSDPGERRNLAEELPERTRALSAELDARLASGVRHESAPLELETGDLERLRALGYAE